jgi:hypothetical protein
MADPVRRIALWVPLAVLVVGNAGQSAEPKDAVRGVLVRPERVTPGFLAMWKAKGATAAVVPLDEATKRNWDTMARVVEQSGMMLWPWIEVARNPAMADLHPDWMAAPGGHHDDWRRRFPNAAHVKAGEVIKAWPWVPLGYAPAFDAHRVRLKTLLADLPGTWAGVFLNDLQAGPSSCGCGNDQCRWAIDYGLPSTASKTPGDDAAARVVAELVARHPGKSIVPIWVTECEPADLPDVPGGTGLCGTVRCAKGDCWPRYARAWNALLKATEGPIALALWPEIFRRDADRWIDADLALFQNPPHDSRPLAAARTIAVVQAWGKPEATVDQLVARVKRLSPGWVFALDPINQSWEPRVVAIPKS